MNPIEVLDNLSDYSLWDIRDYRLSKPEAIVCINALKFYIDSIKKDNENKQGGMKVD